MWHAYLTSENSEICAIYQSLPFCCISGQITALFSFLALILNLVLFALNNKIFLISSLLTFVHYWSTIPNLRLEIYSPTILFLKACELSSILQSIQVTIVH